MIAIKKFLVLLKRRPFVALYALAFVTALGLLFRFIPVVDMALGLASLSGASALDGVVSFARWIASPDIIGIALAAMLGASLFAAMIMALLFAGALGSFAKGMEAAAGFPAGERAGFWCGYQKRFTHIVALFFSAMAIFLLMAFVWLVSSIPLAIVNEMAVRGALGPAVYNFIIAFTVFVVYSGSLFLRLYFMACFPALFSRSKRPIRRAFSYAGRNFFSLARYFVVLDVAQIFLGSIYGFFGRNIALFSLNCVFAAASALFLLFAVFYRYARHSAEGAGGAEHAEEAEGAGYAEGGEDGEGADYDEDGEGAEYGEDGEDAGEAEDGDGDEGDEDSDGAEDA
ncbi:MAG: hypothetical protein LBL83_05940, partial [Clostridiales bacterium]|nr:hypothetical protein [Clostridiales bacterium]